jgi:hypothetical protein
VIPTVGETMRSCIGGQETGNNPRAFSKIGDGEISTAWFFTAFDLGEDYYDLGPYQNLPPVIENFAGSFERTGMAARRGFNTQRILDASESDPNFCESGETPLTCELRLHRPAFAILSLGQIRFGNPKKRSGMRQILEVLLSQNVVPILSTKGDNLKATSYQPNNCLFAGGYHLPHGILATIQPLPNHGLQLDLEHLTYGITDFDDEDAIQPAWTVRNLTALQALDAVWRGVTTQP